MFEAFITILFTNPLPVALAILGAVGVGLAIIGRVSSQPIEGRRAIALGGFGILLIVFAVASACLLALASRPLLPVETPPPATDHSSTPIPINVDSRLGWQATGVLVEAGDHITVEVVSGQWTSWKGEYSYSPGEGGGYTCTEPNCGGPVIGYSSNTLVGHVGGQLFAVGKRATVTLGEQGELFLRINDDDNGLWDNDGMLTIMVSVNQ